MPSSDTCIYAILGSLTSHSNKASCHRKVMSTHSVIPLQKNLKYKVCLSTLNVIAFYHNYQTVLL